TETDRFCEICPTHQDQRERVSNHQFAEDPTLLCRALETGAIVYFPHSPFELREEDKAFLREQKQLASDYFKNISYQPQTGRLKGVKAQDTSDLPRFKAIIAGYSQQVADFFNHYLPPYA